MHWEGRGFTAPFLPARFPPRSPNCPPGRPRARVILALRARPSLPHERRSLFRLPRSSPLLARRGSRAKPTPGAAAGIATEVVVTVDRHREQELAQPWLSSARWRGRRRGRRCVTGENAMQCEESWPWRRRVKGIDAMSLRLQDYEVGWVTLTVGRVASMIVSGFYVSRLKSHCIVNLVAFEVPSLFGSSGITD